MSTDRKSLVQSLAGGDIESTFVSPDKVASAIDEYVDGEAVGIPDEGWDSSLPRSVNWEPTPADLRDAKTGVTAAEFAIADYGSLVLPTSPPASELVSLHVDRHIAVLAESEICPSMDEAFDRLNEDIPDTYCDSIIATGPSSTADMGALVKGAQGPSEIRVVVVEE